MHTPAQIGKHHPIHPVLIVIPAGLWVFSLVSDIIFYAGWGGPSWNTVAYDTMLGGIIGALVAAIPGFIDYFAIRNTKAAKTATKHMISNLTLVVLYIVNLVLRDNTAPSAGGPIILSVIGVGLLLYSAWLGGDMVYEHGVAVDIDHANKDEAEASGTRRYGKQEVKTERERAYSPNWPGGGGE